MALNYPARGGAGREGDRRDAQRRAGADWGLVVGCTFSGCPRAVIARGRCRGEKSSVHTRTRLRGAGRAGGGDRGPPRPRALARFAHPRSTAAPFPGLRSPRRPADNVARMLEFNYERFNRNSFSRL
jgi:hypothetical protein